MSRRFSRRALLRAGVGSLATLSAGCSAPIVGEGTTDRYRLGSLEVINTHDEPHEVLLVVTAEGTARFARQVELPAASHGENGIDSTNQAWTDPVSGPAAYRIHVKVDERPPVSDSYETAGGGDPQCIHASVQLGHREGDLAFGEIFCDEPDS